MSNSPRTCSRSTLTPCTGGRVDTAMRSGAPSSASATDASDGSAASTESMRAASATVVAIAPFSDRPYQSVSPRSHGTTPAPGLMPTSPAQAAGMRIEPMPSLPCAMGTMPEASAAADPPDDPPGVRSGAHGLRVTP